MWKNNKIFKKVITSIIAWVMIIAWVLFFISDLIPYEELKSIVVFIMIVFFILIICDDARNMCENKKFRNFKKIVTSPIVYIGIVLVFFYISYKTPYHQINILLLFCLVLIIEHIFEIFKDARSNEYTTKHFIILTKIIELVCFIAVFIYYLITFYNIDNLTYIEVSHKVLCANLILIIYIILRPVVKYLKSERFKKDF